MIPILTIEGQVKNLIKSFRALHRTDQGCDGGVVQLQTLEESRLQFNASYNILLVEIPVVLWINELAKQLMD